MWLLIPILIYCIVFFYVRHNFIYWQLKGFPCEKSALNPKFLQRVWQREFRLVEAVSEDYKLCRGEHFKGIYLFFKPTLLVLDIELARHMLENSERFFHEPKWDHRHVYKKFNLLEKIRPAFTRELCRNMFKCVESVADNMLHHLTELDRFEHESISIDIEEVIRTYSNDIIGNLVYGLNIDSFKFPDNIFNQHITKLRQSNFFPNASKISFSRLKPTGKYISHLRELLQETIKHRELQNTVRHDILQLFIKLRNSQFISDKPDTIWNIDLVSERQKFLSMSAVVHLAEELMTIGLEPITTTAVYTLLEVLQQPVILNKILQEIKVTQEIHKLLGEELNYEALENLLYLDMCIKETLRIYPGIPLLRRVCSRNYRIPGTRYVLAKGCTVLIPIREMQRDERYYAVPLLYKPERFQQKNGQQLPNRAYFAFGLGARDCLAQPLANVIVKVVLTKLLLRYKLEPDTNAPSYTAAVKKCCKINLKRRKILEHLPLAH